MIRGTGLGGGGPADRYQTWTEEGTETLVDFLKRTKIELQKKKKDVQPLN